MFIHVNNSQMLLMNLIQIASCKYQWMAQMSTWNFYIKFKIIGK